MDRVLIFLHFLELVFFKLYLLISLCKDGKRDPLSRMDLRPIHRIRTLEK